MDAYERTGDWARALDITDSLLVRKPCRPTSERAYEMRRALRRRRGTALGLDYDHTGLSDGQTHRFRPFARVYLSPGIGIGLEGAGGLYTDDQNFDRVDLSERVGHYGGSLYLGARTGADLSGFVRRHLWRVDAHWAFGGKGRLDLGGRGSIELEGSWKTLWSGPVDAVLYEGLLDRLAGTLSLVPVRRVSILAQGSWRRFWIFRNRYFGSERQGSANLGVEVVRRPYASSGGLRAITLSGGYAVSRTEQEADFENRIDLSERSSVTTANIHFYFVFGCRSSLELWGHTGQDTDRGIGFGKLYGIGGRFHADLTSRVSFFARGVYASEATVQAEGGGYREAGAGLTVHLRPRPRERRGELMDETVSSNR